MAAKNHFRNAFIAGVFAAIPIGATAFVLITADRITRDVFYIDYPIVGILLAVVCLYVLGVVVSSVIGKFFLNRTDRLLNRVPLLREAYQAWKHILITPGGTEGIFAQVVMIPGDAPGSWIMGFTSGDPVEANADMCCVFVPAAPNPTNGRLYFIPRTSVRRMDLTNEEAFKLILSGGNYVPPAVGLALPENKNRDAQSIPVEG